MVKINKLFQATLEILSLRRVITKDSNRSNLHNKLNNKFRVSSKRRSGKFRKREDCMLHALVIHRKIQCLINQAFQVKSMLIIIVLLYSKVYLHHKHQIMEEKSITKSRTLWTVTIPMYKYPKNIYKHEKCWKRTNLDSLTKIIKAVNVFSKLSVLLDHETIAKMDS